MKFEKKQVYYVVLAFVLCYAIQAYWSNGASIVGTIYKASFPFLIGLWNCLYCQHCHELI